MLWYGFGNEMLLVVDKLLSRYLSEAAAPSE